MADAMTDRIPGDFKRGPKAQSDRRYWHLPADPWDRIHAKRTGRGIKIAVLDTGIVDHDDLPKPIATKSFIPGESVRDGNFHGTHCAGTALGRSSIGFAPGADLIVGKVLSDRGSGSNAGIAAGIRWAVDQGADIVSMSLGGGGYDQGIVNALEYARDNHVVVFVAAGNSGYRTGVDSVDYPGKLSEKDLCVCVAAYREGEDIANFSSGGPAVDLAMPGERIVSADHKGGRSESSGTSMATPGAAGLWAVIMEAALSEGHAIPQTSGEVKKYLRPYAKDRGRPGPDDRFGDGIPDARNIVDSLAAEDITTMSV